MATVQHAAIADPFIHEPKGVATASAGTIYIANGSGSGTWIKAGTANIDYTALLAALQTDINDGDLDLNGKFWLTAVLADVSTASSILIPVPRSCTVNSARVVLGNAITVADSSVTFQNAAAASMGTAVTVAFTASAKGTGFTFTATGNNVLTGPTWIEVITDGASTTTAPLYITVEFTAVLNP